jgi:NAD-dependent DNA ligase
MADFKSLTDPLLKDPKLIQQTPLTDLEQLLDAADERYYLSDDPLFSDAFYEQLLDEFNARSDTKRPARIGARPTIGKEVRLPIHMGSMDKMKMGTGKVDRWTTSYPGPYLLSSKLDGVSALYTGKKLFTRGDGTTGQDISFLIPHLSLPKIASKAIVRGEILIPRARFRTEAFKKADGRPYENARNTVSGLVNSLEDNYRRDIADACHFVAYERITHGDQQERPSSQLTRLAEMGFRTVDHLLREAVSDEILSALLDEHLLGDYDIDGLIVASDHPYQRNVEGNPDYAQAFKKPIESLIATTTVTTVTWNMTRTRYFKPVLELVPVKIDGVTVKRVTAHNAKYVFDQRLGKGSIIRVLRSGGVIPKVFEVLSHSDQVVGPESPHRWNETEVDLVLDDSGDDGNVKEATRAAEIKRIHHFFHTLDVDSLGEKTVSRIYDHLSTPSPSVNDFLTLKPETLRFLGPKTSVKLHESMTEAVRSADIAELMAASQMFGRGVGKKILKGVIAELPHFWRLTPEEAESALLGLKGIAATTASQIAAGMESFQEFFLSVKDSLSTATARSGPGRDQTDSKDGSFYEEEIVDEHDDKKPKTNTTERKSDFYREEIAGDVSGKPKEPTRTGEVMPSVVVLSDVKGKAKISRAIKEQGGSTSENVTRDTDLLVIGSWSVETTKRKLAQKKGIPVMVLDDFCRKYAIP